jgi:D-xylose transport system permease protein
MGLDIRRSGGSVSFLEHAACTTNKRKHGFELQNIYVELLITGIIALVILVYVYSVNQYRGIQNPVLLLAITAGIMMYVSNNTRFGRYAYAIGGNRDAARLSGISIRGMIFQIFVLMGFLSGVAGVVLASYVGYGTIAAGTGYELDAIASCILGGTSTLGGIGTIPGAMIGALIIASLSTGLQMMNVAPAWQYVLKAIVLVLAVLADVYFKRNR